MVPEKRSAAHSGKGYTLGFLSDALSVRRSRRHLIEKCCHGDAKNRISINGRLLTPSHKKICPITEEIQPFSSGKWPLVVGKRSGQNLTPERSSKSGPLEMPKVSRRRSGKIRRRFKTDKTDYRCRTARSMKTFLVIRLILA